MPIPPFTADGELPYAIYDCTLEEIGERFARFQRSDRRIRLFERLVAYVAEVRRTGKAVAVIINGSFVTAQDEPDDIDLILVLPAGTGRPADLRPFEYNVLTKPGVRRAGYPFDLVVAEEGSEEYRKDVAFFHQIRHSSRLKGLLRVWVQ
jgi:hypothetical protein